MHIVDICAFYTPQGGGVRTYVERKLAVLPRLGHRVTVVVPGPAAGVEERGDGARIISLRTPAFPLDRRYRYFNDEEGLHRLLDQLKPDMVEASSPWASASMVGRWPGPAPRALVMHADPLSAYAYRWLDRILDRATIDRTFGAYWRHLRRLNQRYDLAVCANERLTRRMVAGGLTCAETIPMGIEPGRFSPALRDEALRGTLLASCGLESDAVLLIGVGRLAAEKRWSLVIDAVAALGVQRSVALLLVGSGSERAALQRRIGGNPHIRLVPATGDRDHLARLLATSDALVHGCEAETSGLIVAEARASGLPLVVPDEGGAAELLALGAGTHYHAGDGASLLAALNLTVAELASTRKAALVAAKRPLSMDDHFAALSERYAALLARSLPRAA